MSPIWGGGGMKNYNMTSVSVDSKKERKKNPFTPSHVNPHHSIIK